MIYAVPAVFGLLIKLTILYLAKTSHKSKSFILFIALLSIHNLSELFLFYHIFTETDATLALRMYYACLAGALAGMCVYSTLVSKPEWHQTTTKVVTVVFTLFCSTVMLTPLVIKGELPLGNFVTAIKGDYYFLFQVISITAVAFTLFILFKACFFAQSTHQKIRSAYILASLIPAIIIGLTVLGLMYIGVEINAMAVLPIGTTLILLITLKAENHHNMTDIRMYLPLSKERKVSQDLINVMSEYSVSGTDYKTTVREIEKILFNYSYEKADFCKSTTAKRMNISRSTLYGMLDRLDIK
ncbi:MAG: hypothetical protein ACRBEE_01810 [Arenicella sp.]